MDTEFVARVRGKVFVEISGGVSEGGEDERFPVGFAVPVDRWLADFRGDQRFEFGKFAIAPRSDGTGFLQQLLKLLAVILNRPEPFR